MSSDEVLEVRVRLDAVADRLGELGALVAEHTASMKAMAEKVDGHLAEHRAQRERWVGMVFTVIGAAVLVVGSWLAGVVGAHFGRR